MRKIKLLFLLPVFIGPIACFAGGIRGQVKGDDGIVLPYATIYVKQTGTGSASDLQGRYEVVLAPGHYDVYFQFLGYETISRSVEIGEGFLELNVVLKTHALVLPAVTVRAGKEDPAYTIMRKAIAKARYHTQQVDSFSAKVYIKGKGKLNDYPWLAKKALEKEGISKDRLFIQESVSEIQYKRPNKIKEKVIAIYTQGKNNNTSPNEYIFGSFYEPEIAETVSPLSPRSFSYYRFEYLGSFKDRDHEISKIKVTPRTKGDNVFDGLIYIVEEFWSIHSLDLNATRLGVKVNVKQIYNPIEDKKKPGAEAWMPVTQTFKLEGSIFGFDFEGQYLATVKDYLIFLNPALKHEITVVDEKEEMVEDEKKPVIATKPANSKTQKTQIIQQKLADGKEVTNKELNQLMKEYEKEEQKQQKDPEVIAETSFKVDSLARKKDSVFWAEMRPAALEPEEVRGYHTADSMAVIEQKNEEGDSLKESKNKGFQLLDILRGDRYRLTKTTDFFIHTPYGGFNTVEGFNIIYRLGFSKRWVKYDSLYPENRPKTSRFDVTPVFRYSFSRNTMTGLLRTEYRTRQSRISLEGGRYIQQYNAENPIHHFVNTFTTLLLERNLMKIYERDFVEFTYRQRFNDKLTLWTAWSWNRRYELLNNSQYKLISSNKEAYTANAPINNELANTSFPDHEAFLGSVKIESRPWQKFRIRNGFKYRVDNSSPIFSLEYRKGFSGILGSDVDYDLLDIGIRYGLKLGIRGKLDLNLHAGQFLNNSKMFFMDYKHFLGNLTPFSTTDPVGSFRLLDYYQYSTSDQYFTANAHYHFRKFLVTLIPKIRLIGIQENVFINYLTTPFSGNYSEVGYSLDGILRIFRLEAAASFANSKYQGYGFRIGIASSISVNFGD